MAKHPTEQSHRVGQALTHIKHLEDIDYKHFDGQQFHCMLETGTLPLYRHK